MRPDEIFGIVDDALDLKSCDASRVFCRLTLRVVEVSWYSYYCVCYFFA